MLFGKVWGRTKPILLKPQIEMHEIHIKEGAYCSRHHHRCKYNMFYVISGQLKVKTWKRDYNLVDETILGPGESTIQPPGEDHQFEALSDVVCLELYWTELDHNDIVRADVGGVG